MSHTTEIKSVPIRDVAALRMAVNELKQKGVKCELREKAKPRMYYENQHGICDYVLHLSDSSYDVGFEAVTDSKTKQVDYYKLILDTWSGQIQSQIGITNEKAKEIEASTGNPVEAGVKAIAQLSQLYTKNAATNSARLRGWNVRSSTVDDRGNVQLVLAGGQ